MCRAALMELDPCFASTPINISLLRSLILCEADRLPNTID